MLQRRDVATESLLIQERECSALSDHVVRITKSYFRHPRFKPRLHPIMKIKKRIMLPESITIMAVIAVKTINVRNFRCFQHRTAFLPRMNMRAFQSSTILLRVMFSFMRTLYQSRFFLNHKQLRILLV